VAARAVVTLAELRALLRALDAAALAALLHELGFELYRRELSRWRVVSDLADELLDESMHEARVRLARTLTRLRKPLTRSRRQRSRRRAG
jgi:hypothetical protein